MEDHIEGARNERAWVYMERKRDINERGDAQCCLSGVKDFSLPLVTFTNGLRGVLLQSSFLCLDIFRENKYVANLSAAIYSQNYSTQSLNS